MSTSRRTLLKSTALGALTFMVGGKSLLLTPRQARAENIAFAVLDDEEVAILSAFGEALAPGAAEAGIAHFVDAQLAADPDDALLTIRYVDVPPEAWADFYKGGLAALEALSHERFSKGVAQLSVDEAETLAGAIADSQPPGWEGPPAPFFFFVVRADAIDVTYGTKEGFDRLGIPYLAHVEPKSSW